MRISDWSSDVCSSDLVGLELRLHRGLDLLDLADDLLDLVARALVQQGDARAGAGGVAGRVDVLQRAVGNHAQQHGVLGVDVAAEGAGQHDLLDLLDAKAVHQQADAGVERGLAELDGAHRSEERTSALQSLMSTSYAVFCLKKKTRRHKGVE